MPETVRVKAFGELLKELRNSVGWSVEQAVLYLRHQHKPSIEANQGTISGYEQGWREKPIKDWFGHRDVKTTRIYTGMVAKRLKATGSLLAGRIGWKKLVVKAGS